MIQSFRAELPWPEAALLQTVDALEAALQPRLPQRAELLRWAVVQIVRTSDNEVSLVCEGAWMLTPSECSV